MSEVTGLERPTAIFTDYVRDWKDGGGCVLGYACVATPVEIMEAAGLLPYRIKALGHPETYLADGELSLFNCSYCRSCLQLALDGTYDFLDGVVETNGCDHMRTMFENWQHTRHPDFFHYLKVPHFASEESVAYFEEELAIFRDAIAEHFGVEITDERLEAAIESQDDVRGRLREVYDLRRGGESSVSGSEFLSLVIAGSSMRSGDFSGLLSRFIEEKSGAVGARPRVRLLLCGAAIDEVEWLEEIERMGGAIVADALCFGARAFWRGGASTGSPLHRIAYDYISNLFCPRMYTEYGRRRDFIMDRAREAGVDGVVILYNKFCDLHGVDAVLLRRDLEAEGFPVLVLEKEYSAKADIGRVRTRMQAFMEKIGGA